MELCLGQSVTFDRFQQLAMAKRLRRRREANFFRCRVNQIVRRPRLDEPGLLIAAGPENDALNKVRGAASHNYIDCPLLA